MKRIIGLFVVILALHGCKKNQPGTAPLQLVSPPDCITLSDYDHLTNNKDRADWLVAQGKLVCDSILYAREVEHEVLAADVNVSSSAKPYVMKWEAMETLLGALVYENYVGFELDTEGDVVNVKLVPGYDENGNTYSVPMFRSIGLKYNFAKNTEIDFVAATVKGELKIVVRFKDKDGDYVYYDYNKVPV
ncbi:MAG: hypothetical protein IPN80_13900 [Flavobacterium sp.]|nr:hypothetical protein [Flavobacterium sp.]